MKNRRPTIPQPRCQAAPDPGHTHTAKQTDSLPQHEKLQIAALFDAGRHAELENRAHLLLEHHPDSGFTWKALGIAQLAQGRDGLLAIQRAAELLPEDAGVHITLGNAKRKIGRLEDAAASYRRGLAIKPDHANTHFNLANTLMGLRQIEAAMASYYQALAIQPNYAEAYCNLGIALERLGRTEDAMTNYRRALEIKPLTPETHCNLGNILRDLRQFDDALASYRRAVEIKPDFANAHYNLGKTLKDLGRLEDAVESVRQALVTQPDFTEAHILLGNILKDLGRLNEAEASYRYALETQPDDAGAHFNLGNVLGDLGRLEAAVASYHMALEVNPDYAEAHNNLGSVLKDLGRFTEAEVSYRRALTIQPDYAEAHSNLGNVMKDLGRLEEAVTYYQQALSIKPDYVNALSNLLFTYNYLADKPAEILFSEAQRYGALVARQSRPYTDWPITPEIDRCLRVGLVSGDLGNHPVGYFVDGTLAALDSSASGRMEIFAYLTHSRTDILSERIKAHCQGWQVVEKLSDEQLARQIRADRIDILIDLSGHTAYNRLPMFALKPAPIQVSWLGYFSTTGVAEVDYLIADPWTLPATDEIHFTEKIWRLPETRLCFTPPDAEVFVSALPALKNGHVTFGCFNNLTKINDAVVALWTRVLRVVENSRLFLKAKQLDEPSVRRGVINNFAIHGIAEDRLILEGTSPRTEYLAAYSRVDIALDPFPFTGGTTSAESLWMGVPVLTLAGDHLVSRQGVSMMMNIGLPDWIAVDANDYVTRAALHASDIQRLAGLRSGLRHQALVSPLFDAPRFVQNFESALCSMWSHWCHCQIGGSAQHSGN